VGCTIYEEKLPIDTITFETLKELKIVATTIALNGGEDYELVFTIKQDDYEKVKDLKSISVIGYMTTETAGKNLITIDNCQIELKAQGFQPGAQN
jgi:thiamine-monophosphate kinase